MKVRLVFAAEVKDSDDIRGLREQVAMCFEALGDVRLVSVSPVKGSEPLKVERGAYGCVMLSDKEYALLAERFGKARADRLIDDFSYKMYQKHYRFKDHFAAIVEWEEERENPPTANAVRPPFDKGGKGTSFDVDEFFNANLERGIGK